ncbi:hypothetical protein CFBP2533_25750 [Xanthomonas hortorum pv. pelargonii]|uniref:Uncharacterized protein n=1 Tax=Xanthomonas hortorum pv. pelargonii TaxID=453602 RepID=A0A6V7DNT1_9XANT|nr:hypothetical protein CFBP2533_25750 [Xanthomonas hortorum pv. pelargonii]CAD0337837.1 hypothetical protein CFBP2533_25750 [Xanthomonas hortorum pv. pelargonii]
MEQNGGGIGQHDKAFIGAVRRCKSFAHEGGHHDRTEALRGLRRRSAADVTVLGFQQAAMN